MAPGRDFASSIAVLAFLSAAPLFSQGLDYQEATAYIRHVGLEPVLRPFLEKNGATQEGKDRVTALANSIKLCAEGKASGAACQPVKDYALAVTRDERNPLMQSPSDFSFASWEQVLNQAFTEKDFAFQETSAHKCCTSGGIVNAILCAPITDPRACRSSGLGCYWKC